jgi:hypothetical protein
LEDGAFAATGLLAIKFGGFAALNRSADSFVLTAPQKLA